MNRIFLNWNKPLLQTAADYFVKRFTRDGGLNMRNVSVAVSGKQAGLRLEELLAERAETLENPAWEPPEIITFGQLPEKFYIQKNDFADELTQSFAWVNAVENAPAELSHFLPKLPDSIMGRLRFGQLFAALHKELTAEDLDFIKVAEHCKKHKLSCEFQRWKVFSALQKHYLTQLDSLNIWDRYSAILYAVSHQSEEEYRGFAEQFRLNGTHFFLLGVADMNKVQKDILSKFKEFITPLIFAPENYRDKFDEFGCLKPEQWMDEPAAIDDRQIAVAEDVQGQADEVLRGIDALNGQYCAGEIVAGVPDVKLLPVLEQRFERANLQTQYIKGLPIHRTAVFRLLEILPELMEPAALLPAPNEVSYRAFAEFLRHPDTEFFVRKSIGTAENNILTLLDHYHAEHLPETVNEIWLDNVLADETHQTNNRKALEQLKAVWVSVQKLLTVNVSQNNAEILNGLLQQFYDETESKITEKALTLIRQTADAVMKIPSKLLSSVSFSDFLRLVLVQLENEFIPPFDKPEAVELLGWLDLVMNDAPVMLITGMNDGTVPSYINEDMFLPDNLRQSLGITDNRKRIARDTYNLLLILNTRQKNNVKLITGRRSAQGDAQLPSRLFFAADDTTVCQRVKRFFGEQTKLPPAVFQGEVQKKKEFRFAVPPAEKIGGTFDAINVTDFRVYKECPYRFYLKRLKHLQHLDDAEEELAANTFGSLIHKTLEYFGKSDVKDSDDAALNELFVTKTFDELVQQQFGAVPKAAVSLQFGIAKERLRTFAKKQTERRKDGWRIIATEIKFEKSDGIKILDGVQPMYLKGRLDRIDRNEKTGEYAVLDYKTSDSAAKPEEVHCKRKKDAKEWLDFQLPLYDFLLRNNPNGQKVEVPASGVIRLGYFILPKDSEGGVVLAEWPPDELAEAVTECREIARKIRNNEFEMSKNLPKYDDFPEICQPGNLK